MKKPVIGITIGDVAGIGPEIVEKLLLEERVHRMCVPVQIGDKNAVRFTSGRPSKKTGAYAMECIKNAVEFAMNGTIDAIVTAPISKTAIRMAGYNFEGHTDYLAYLTGAKEYSMMLINSRLKVVLVTIHLPIKEVPEKIQKRNILRAIRHADLGARLLGIDNPRIAVCSLNPHGVEFGTEDKEVVIPAVRQAKRRYNVFGPFPSDSLFWKALKGEFDVGVAMYHDQGLIPIKLLGFEEGVNITIGLPIIRVSPDHGTGYDIVGKGIASHKSIMKAVEVAVRMVKNKREMRL